MTTETGETRPTLPMASTSAHDDGTACTCGEENKKHVTLDARLIPHAVRHASIFGALDALEADGSLDIIAGHRPMPLLAQLEQRSPGVFNTEFILESPNECVVRFTRS